MRAYDEEALRRLLDEHTTLRAFGADVLAKRSTEEDRPGLLDPYLVAHHEQGQTRDLDPGTGRFRMLLKAMVRPERFLVDMRIRAQALALNADNESTLDLADGAVEISDEELVLREHRVKLWKYAPAGAGDRSRPAFLHLHGGGFFAGQPTGHDNALRYIADRADAVVFDLDYSLSPEVKFPHAVHQVLAVVRRIHDHAVEYGIDPSRIVVGGGSAGANLTAAATLLERRRGTAMIAAQVLVSPALLFGRTKPPGYSWSPSDFVIDETARRMVGRLIDPGSDLGLRIMVNAYRGGRSTDDPLLSPALAPDLSGLPPALVITCEMDSLRPQGEFYASRLASAGVPVRTLRYRGIMHATAAEFGHVPAAEAITLEIVRVLRPRTAVSPPRRTLRDTHQHNGS